MDLFFLRILRPILLLLAAALISVPVPARAATSASLVPLGRVAGEAVALALDGDIAYLGEGAGLVVLNIADPAVPQRIALLPLPNQPTGIAIGDGLAAVSLAEHGLAIVDLSDLAAPQLRSIVPVALDNASVIHSALDVALDGQIAYIVDGVQSAGYFAGGWLCAYDLSDPAQPVELSRTEISGYPTALRLAGGFAYVASRSTPRIVGGLEVFNIADPAAPVLQSFLGDYNGATDIDLGDGIAYLPGMGVVDLANPEAPLRNPPQDDMLFRLNGSLAYGIEAYRSSLKIYDLTEPLSPTVVGQIPADTESPLRTISEMRVAAGRLYLTTDSGLYIYTLDDPLQPALVGNLGTGGVTKILADGEHVYGSGTLFWLPVAENPLALVPVSTLAGISTSSSPSASLQHVAGGIGYIAYLNSVFLVDLATPEAPPLSEIDLGTNGARPINEVSNIQVVGNRAYIQFRRGSSGRLGSVYEFRAYDISDPTAPQLIGALYEQPITFEPYMITGTVAYVADNDTFSVLDLSDPSAPVDRGRFEVPGITLNAMQIVGNRLYAAGEGGLAIFDLSDPIKPQLRSRLELEDTLFSVAANESYAIVRAKPFELVLIDTANPDSPQVIGTTPTAGPAFDLALVGNRLYVAHSDSGIEIFELQVTQSEGKE